MNANMNNGNNGVIINEVNPPSGVMGPVQGSSDNSSDGKKKKNTGRIVLLSVLVILIVLLGGFGFWYFNNKKLEPVKVYQNAINDLYDVMKSGLKNVQNISNNQILMLDPFDDPFTINLKAKMDTNIEMLQDYSGYQYTLSGGVDYKNKKIAIKGDIGKNGREIIDAFLLQTNNNLYLKSVTGFSKILNLGNIDIFEELSLDELKKELETTLGSSSANIDPKELEKITLDLKNIIVNSFDKKKFTTSDSEVTIDGKKIKVKKISYNFDKSNQERTTKYIFREMARNDSLIGFLAEASGNDKNTIKGQIEGVIEKVNVEDSADVVFNLYVDGNDKVIAGDAETEGMKVISFTNGEKLIFTSSGLQIIIDRQKDFDDISIVSNGIEFIGIKSYKLDKEFKLEFRINFAGEVKGNGEISVSNISISESKISNEVSLKFNVDVEGKNYNMAVDFGLELLKGNIETFDTLNSVGINNLSEEELRQIIDNLDKALVNTPFYEIVKSLKALLPDIPSDENYDEEFKCASSYDCVCSAEVCKCKYLNNGIEEDINCRAYTIQ